MPHLVASIAGVEIRKIYLHKDRTSLGRRTDNDIVLENMAVSGRHCLFELKGLADVFVVDLCSTNATFVNNQKITRQQLNDGDVVAVGKFRLRFYSASEEPSGFGETSAMRLEPDGTFAAEGAPMHASFHVLSGSSTGQEMPVMKAVTTFGTPGVAVVAVSHRRSQARTPRRRSNRARPTSPCCSATCASSPRRSRRPPGTCSKCSTASVPRSAS